VIFYVLVAGVHGATTVTVYVVAEGTYTMKANERKRRSDAAKTKIAAGKFKQALGLPDCIVRWYGGLGPSGVA
jgi:hypothetical protein